MNENTTTLIKTLFTKYKETGINDFLLEDYINIENYSLAIKDALNSGCMYESNDVTQTLHFTDSFIKEFIK